MRPDRIVRVCIQNVSLVFLIAVRTCLTVFSRLGLFVVKRVIAVPERIVRLELLGNANHVPPPEVPEVVA